MKKLITALSLIAIILIISACSPAGGDNQQEPGTIDLGQFATLHLDEKDTSSFEGSIEILKQSKANGAELQFKTDKEEEATKDKIFVVGGTTKEAGAMFESGKPLKLSYDNNGVATINIEIEANSAEGTVTFIFSSATNPENKISAERTIPTGSTSMTISLGIAKDEKGPVPLSKIRLNGNFKAEYY